MKALRVPFNRQRSQRGSAVIVVMGLLAIMAICVSVNLAAIHTVDRELKFLDKKQTQHWQSKSIKSNNTNSSTNGTASPP